MTKRSTNRTKGFSLLEMTVATALGSLVVGAAVQLYVQGVGATWTVSQRAEMQQDFRAASNMLTKDLSLAGAGLTQGAAIQLPTSSSIPVLGCDQSSTCYINGASVNYPLQGTTPFLYGLLTGYNAGPTISGQTTDTVTVVYTDPNFYLDCYTATVASATTVTFALPTSTSSNCTAPSSSAIQNINDSAVGLTPGDLVLFTFGTTPIVAEVYGATTSSTTATFSTSDPLKMNQATTVPKSLGSEYNSTTATTGYGVRLLVVTYYLDNSVTPPRLMRQISGHSPVPVAESVVYLKFSYDLFNTNTNTVAVSCQNPGATGDVCTSGSSSGLLPNQITQIHVLNMAMDGSVKGSLYGLAGGNQSIDLQTTVSARNLTYVNSYSN
ncbi:MAG: prepilin-type N-terminal cleavage/methylation domain-containing protein [Terriglobales bacterium]